MLETNLFKNKQAPPSMAYQCNHHRDSLAYGWQNFMVVWNPQPVLSTAEMMGKYSCQVIFFDFNVDAPSISSVFFAHQPLGTLWL